MSEEPVTPQEPGRRKRPWWILGMVAGIIFVFLYFLPTVPSLLVLLFHLVCGWVLHACLALPLLLADWQSMLRPLAALLVAGLLLHRFIRWAIPDTERDRLWPLRHTLAAMSLLLLGYGAAITLIGIAHQSTWLLAERWIDGGMWKIRERSKTWTSVLKVMEALEEFQATHGRYPESLLELKVPAEFLLVQTGGGSGLEPFVYRKPDAESMDERGGPMIVSPQVGWGEFVVGFNSTEICSMKWEELAELLLPPPSGTLNHPDPRR